MSAEDIVDVQIIANTSSPDRAGFGVPLLMGYHTNWLDRVREYGNDLTELTDDGFAVTDPIYKMAANMLAQNPAVSKFKVGRLANAYTQTVELTPTDTTEGQIYSVTIGAETATFTVPAAATVAIICAGLESAINALTGAFTATDNTTEVSVAADVAGTLFGYSGINRQILDFEDVTADPGVAADLNAIVAEDPAWYGLAVDAQNKAMGQAIAAIAETLNVIFVMDSMDAGMVDAGSTTDWAYLANASAYDRVGTAFHANSGQWLSAAWLGKMLPTDPGSATWKFKTLAGITVDTLRAAEVAALVAKKSNYYTECNGINITCEGWAASGTFFDETRFIDWLSARISEGAFKALVDNPKLPYTNAGIEVILNIVRARLSDGIDAGGLSADPAPVVTAPSVASIDAADKAARCVPNIKFTATLAGAIHKVQIRGTLVL